MGGWLWGVAGLVLIGAAVMGRGRLLGWIGSAALTTALIAMLLPMSLSVQAALFAITAALACVGGWTYRRGRARGAAR